MNYRDFRNAAEWAYSHIADATNNPVPFLRTKNGARLGVDGVDAFRATPHDLFTACLSAALDMHAASNRDVNMRSWLEVSDQLLGCSRGSPAQIWPLITVGIAGVEALGGPPEISTSEHSIFNDSLMLVLSKNYRAVRFSAYNEGATFQISKTQRDDAFRPEFGVLSLGAPVVNFDADVPFTQFYNIAHEMSHISLLGDTYIRAKGSQEATAATLLAAEESLIGLDLLMMHEINQHSLDFHVAECFRGIEPGMQESTPISIATLAVKNPTLIRIRQRELKAHAARESGLNDFITQWMIRRCPRPTNIDQWVPRNARKKHIEGAHEFAHRVCGTVFSHLMSFIPLDHVQQAHELRAITTEWGYSDMIFGIEIPEIVPERRAIEMCRWMLRQRLIRLAEVSSFLSSTSPERKNADFLFTRDLMLRYGPLAARGALASMETEPVRHAIDEINSLALAHLTPIFGEKSEQLLTNAITPLTELI